MFMEVLATNLVSSILESLQLIFDSFLFGSQVAFVIVVKLSLAGLTWLVVVVKVVEAIVEEKRTSSQWATAENGIYNTI